MPARSPTETDVVVMAADSEAGCGKGMVSRSPCCKELQVGGGDNGGAGAGQARERSC